MSEYIEHEFIIEKCVRGLHRSLSALNWLPQDSGPIRQQAGAAIQEIRTILEEVNSKYPHIVKKVFEGK